MREANTKDRIAFLAEKFDVFETTTESMEEKFKQLEDQGFKPWDDIVYGDEILAMVFSKKKSEESSRELKKICVSLDTFSSIIAADPTPNKSCVQWMLNVFTRLCMGDLSDKAAAVRFIREDLPQASAYITLFEANKRKNKFKQLCKSSYIINNSKNPIKDPTDINQYRSLSQLYDAIDPFIVREPGTLESLLLRYVQAGDAEIPVRDRKFTLYIPLTMDASTVFHEFASWCTAKPGYTNFTSYTNQKTPLGTKSKLYIIINNKFFEGKSQELYQIHFESNQIKDRRNTPQNVSVYENVIHQSESLSNFFYEELMTFAKAYRNSSGQQSIDTNPYLKHLVEFGFTESMFELMEAETPTIRIMKKSVPRLPNMNRFKQLDQLTITDAGLVEIDESIGKLSELTMLCLANNRIKSLPASIGNLKNLGYINLANNPLQDIPEEIKYLDISNGGSLFRITINESDIGKENFTRLRKLLPNILIS
jgi:Leucine-rich repeat (LRR) protein